MQDPRRKLCLACGAIADFVALLPEYGEKTVEERVPLVWQCRRCGLLAPVVRAHREAV